MTRKLGRSRASQSQLSDQPTAALIKGLKQRSLLDSTLMVWDGAVGRTPIVEIRNTAEAGNDGRNHNPRAYSMWAADGGLN